MKRLASSGLSKLPFHAVECRQHLQLEFSFTGGLAPLLGRGILYPWVAH